MKAVSIASLQTLTVVLVTACLMIPIGGCGGGSSQQGTIVQQTPPNPVPTLTSISPAVLAAGGPDATVSVSGSNFTKGSSITLGGSTLTTTFVSSSQLSAVVPAADLASPASLQLAVSNPSPGGGSSSPHALNVFQVSSLVLLGTPSTVGQPSGVWQLAISAADPSGHPVPGLPITLQTSGGTLSASQRTTDANGGLTATLAPPTNTSTAAVSAITGAQTAEIQIAFSMAAYSRGKFLNRRRTQSPDASQAGLSILSVGLGNAPGIPNVFTNTSILQSQCASSASLSVTETTTCQEILGTNNIQLSAPSLINASCQVASVTSTAVSLAECGITVATVLSCAFSESGIGAAMCAAGADFTVTDAAPACIEFLAQQIANQFGTSSVTAGAFEAEGLVEDPTDPLNLASVVCTIAQSLFPSGPLIYAVNYYNNSISVMDVQGNIVAMPQGAFPQLNAPDGLAFDPDSGLLYAGNSGNGTVTAYDPTTGSLATTSGGFPPGPCTGYDVIYEKFSHDLYVNEPFCNQMIVYDANGDVVGAFSGITTPFGMTWNQLNNQILIADGFNNRIFLCDTSGSSCVASGSFPGLSGPDDLVVTPDGNIYVPNENNGTVTEYDPTGSLIRTISLPNLTGFPVPETVTFYATDSLTYQILISDTAQNVIWVYDSGGNQIAALGGVGVLNGPKGITVIP